MNANAERNIREMHGMTYGVEVEMTHIKRATFAEAMTTVLGGHVEHIGGYYDKYGVRDSKGRMWLAMSDGSIQDATGIQSGGCEFVTPVLNFGDPDDMETFQEILRVARKRGAWADSRYMCGIHVHVGCEGLTAKDLRNLVNIMYSHEDLLSDAIQISAERRPYCEKTAPGFIQRINAEKPKTLEALADIWYETNGDAYDRDCHYNTSRYHMLNLHSFYHGHGTVEFRCYEFHKPKDGLKSGIHAGWAKACVQLSVAMVQAARESAKTSAKKVQLENPRYAMRTWMNRMYMIGDEFETARNLMTKDLDGDTAWRHGNEN